MSDEELIDDILELSDELASLTRRGREHFNEESVARRASERLVQIIGDITGQFSEEFRRKNPALPYTTAKRMRNVIVHQYKTVDPALVWEAMDLSIPKLTGDLRLIRTYGDRGHERDDDMPELSL